MELSHNHAIPQDMIFPEDGRVLKEGPVPRDKRVLKTGKVPEGRGQSIEDRTVLEDGKDAKGGTVPADGTIPVYGTLVHCTVLSQWNGQSRGWGIPLLKVESKRMMGQSMRLRQSQKLIFSEIQNFSPEFRKKAEYVKKMQVLIAVAHYRNVVVSCCTLELAVAH